MPSKWKKILRGKKLPPLPVDPGWRDKVNEERNELAGLKLLDLAREFDRAKTRKEKHEASIKELNVTLEALTGLLLDRMDDQALESVTLDGVVFYPQVEPYATVENKDALFAYIKSTRQKALLTIHWQTLNALIKENLIHGKPAPPGVKVFLKTGLRRREAQP